MTNNNDSASSSRPDTAVILVAGVGARLRPLTLDRPKALVDLGGETILGRALRLLADAGVRHFVLATGYREDAIVRELDALGVRATLCPNPDYETTQNSVSLLQCRAALAGRSFFKLDGDVVFRAEVLARLMACTAELAVAVDSHRELDAEAMKVSVEAGQITGFGKHIPVAAARAETIGIEVLDARAGQLVLERIAEAVAAGRRDAYYEDFYSELVAAQAVRAAAVEVGDQPWSEVDTFEDLERARAVLHAS
jgi:choline kinase